MRQKFRQDNETGAGSSCRYVDSPLFTSWEGRGTLFPKTTQPLGTIDELVIASALPHAMICVVLQDRDRPLST